MRVVVVGGGVAGAASAIALRRIGAEVTVHEAHEEPAGPVGSFVSLAANGLRAVAVLGCLPRVREAGFAVPWQRMWSSAGRPLGEVARGRARADDMVSVTLMRADLVAALRAEAVRLGARIVTGSRLDAAHVRACLDGGVDLVVGADGIWSGVREVLDPLAPRPVYGAMFSVSGVSRADGLRVDAGTFNMIFARRGAFLHLGAPDGSVWWSAQVSGPRPADVHAVGLDDLLDIYRTEPRAVEILRATRRTHGATLHHVLARVPRHHGDRLVLVGDAAHPVGAGQGASMALEDAIALAQHLHAEGVQAEGAVGRALDGYERQRRARVDKMAKEATRNREVKTARPIARRMRNVIMPIVFPRVYEGATSWLHGHDPGALPA
ncbi:FAD-dependent monooxygenase [Frankia sp. AiPs1]|uniref:FAD-dependent oxidoreductase n=1 Tax=Frankia sp. AiPs1 TaxID=573493 RepID=UPI00204405B5|nr:NAD(P)/FAD-dependent oxidoreductase [Frankia sp. AiPs1]MCM3924764.1 FAD-dependent monooxygenase [Frankia sp. AiPs1]